MKASEITRRNHTNTPDALTVNTLIERDNLTVVEGVTVYVRDENKTFLYQAGIWNELETEDHSKTSDDFLNNETDSVTKSIDELAVTGHSHNYTTTTELGHAQYCTQLELNDGHPQKLAHPSLLPNYKSYVNGPGNSAPRYYLLGQKLSVTIPRNTSIQLFPFDTGNANYIEDVDADDLTITYANRIQSDWNVTISGDKKSLHVAPPNNYVGVQEIKFTVTDGNYFVEFAYDVTTTNQSPVANPDNYIVPYKGSLYLDVLSNDTDPEGDPIAIASFTQPAHGSVNFQGNGLIYSINENWSGPTTFNYSVSDNDKTSQTTVTINVQAPVVTDPPVASNICFEIPVRTSAPTVSAPIANDDSYTTDFETPIEFSVLSNDTNVDQLVSFTQTSNGSLHRLGNQFLYSPNDGFDGNDSFNYTVANSIGVTDSAVVSLTVNEEVIVVPPAPSTVNLKYYGYTTLSKDSLFSANVGDVVTFKAHADLKYEDLGNDIKITTKNGVDGPGTFDIDVDDGSSVSTTTINYVIEDKPSQTISYTFKQTNYQAEALSIIPNTEPVETQNGWSGYSLDDELGRKNGLFMINPVVGGDNRGNAIGAISTQVDTNMAVYVNEPDYVPHWREITGITISGLLTHTTNANDDTFNISDNHSGDSSTSVIVASDPFVREWTFVSTTNTGQAVTLPYAIFTGHAGTITFEVSFGNDLTVADGPPALWPGDTLTNIVATNVTDLNTDLQFGVV